MNIKLPNTHLQDRFKYLLKVISHDRFLKMEGIGSEVPFFICPYDPKDSLEMESLQNNLLKNLDKKGISVLSLDLYDLTIDMLKKDGDWKFYIENENQFSKKQLLEGFKAILDVKNCLIPVIENKMKSTDFEVMFISGVGKVFPYIRAHNLLNNLQSSAKEHPTVIFFPGEYSHSSDGSKTSLNLFGKFSNQHYYRAYNIYEYRV